MFAGTLLNPEIPFTGSFSGRACRGIAIDSLRTSNLHPDSVFNGISNVRDEVLSKGDHDHERPVIVD
jgi:hypothetical protein